MQCISGTLPLTETPRGSNPSASKKPRAGATAIDLTPPVSAFPLLLQAQSAPKPQLKRWKGIEKEALQDAVLNLGLGDNKALARSIQKKGVDKDFEQVRWKLTKNDMRKWIRENASRIPGLNQVAAVQALQNHHAQGEAEDDEEEDSESDSIGPADLVDSDDEAQPCTYS